MSKRMEPELYRWLPVRCCCQPQKVIGFLSLASELARPGTAAVPRKPVPARIAWWERELAVRDLFVEIEIRTFVDGGTHEIAVYADERPMEFWRGLAGFVEAARQEEQ